MKIEGEKGKKSLHTKTLDKSSPGMNPARTGTSAVAKDQASTPISRTFLHQ